MCVLIVIHTIPYVNGANHSYIGKNQLAEQTDTDTDRPKTGTDTLVPKADIDFLRKSFKFYDREK